jgi:rod shape-determining protein MreC
MESFFSRYKNPLILMAVLFVQVIMLATQVRRPDNPKNSSSGGTRLIRVWAVTVFTPVERAFIGTGHFFRNTWHNYVDLHDVRKENARLQQELQRLRMEQVKWKEDAEQAHRLQALLGFKERFISQTVAAQVIGTSGSEQSRMIYIDKGSRDGLRPDMAVITPDGIVGKVKDVYSSSSQVLLINDRDSGAGVKLTKSRLQGILHGTPQGETLVNDIMNDEKIEAGEELVTSGGDRIYPKGLPVGAVTNVAMDRDNPPFLAITVKPAANLSRLEEVLVVTKIAEESPVEAQNSGLTRAADILAQRLPTVHKTEEKPGGSSSAQTGNASATPSTPKKPTDGTAVQNKQTKKAIASGGSTATATNSVSTAAPSQTPASKTKKTGPKSARPDATKTVKPETPPPTTENPPE